MNPYASPGAPLPARQRSAGVIALLAAAGTLVGVVLLSLVLIMTLTDQSAMFERGRLVGRGAAMLSFWVGMITYAVIRARRSAHARARR